MIRTRLGLATSASMKTTFCDDWDVDVPLGENRDDCSLAASFENGETLSANAHLNEIAKVADAHAIRSGLYADMTNRWVGLRVLQNCSSS